MSYETLMQVVSQPENWSDVNAAGEYVMLDPVSGNQIDPNAPPAWIAEDPDHGTGLDFLRARGQDIAMTLAFGKTAEMRTWATSARTAKVVSMRRP